MSRLALGRGTDKGRRSLISSFRTDIRSKHNIQYYFIVSVSFQSKNYKPNKLSPCYPYLFTITTIIADDNHISATTAKRLLVSLILKLGSNMMGRSAADKLANITPWWQAKTKPWVLVSWGLTTGVDDAEVLPSASVTRISKLSRGSSDETGFLSLAAVGQNLQSHGRLALWNKDRDGETYVILCCKTMLVTSHISVMSIPLDHQL